MIKLKEFISTNCSSYNNKENWSFVNYLDTGNITENKIDTVQQINLNNEKLPSRAKRKVKIGDIIYSTVRPNQLHYGIIKSIPENFLVSTGFTTISTKINKADSSFVYYYLTQSELIEHLQSIAEQSVSTYPSIKASDIEDLEVEFPPLETQKQIAKILSSIDDKIELNNKINDNLEQQAQAIFKSWFVDFEPFGGVMPSEWEKSDIYSISNIVYGAPFKSKLFNVEGDGLPIIRIRDLKKEYSEVYTPEVHPKGRLIELGDIVVGMDGEFRPHIWGGDKAWLNQRVCIFENKRNNGSFFLYFTIKPLLNHVEETEVATTVIHIGKNDFDAFEIFLPTNDILDKFDLLSEPIYQSIVNNKLENKRLAMLRDTLLPKLMSGEIDVSQVEI